MKKKLSVFIVFVLVFMFPMCSYAKGYGNVTDRFEVPKYMFNEELLSSEVTKDTYGRIKSGYFFDCGESTNKMVMQTNRIWNSEDGFLYITKEERLDHTLENGVKKYSFVIWCSSSMRNLYVTGHFPITSNGDEAVGNYAPIKELAFSDTGYSFAMLTFLVDSSLADDVKQKEFDFYCTNIPVFDIEDKYGIELYKSTGDYSNAENSDDIDRNNSTIDSSVEKPINLTIDGGAYDKYLKDLELHSFSHDLVASWEQSVNTMDYSYDVDVRITFSKYKEGISTSADAYGGKLWTYTGKWYSARQDFPYLGEQKQTLRIGQDVLNSLFTQTKQASGKLGTYYDPLTLNVEKLEVRVRNRNGNLASGYVRSTIDFVKRTVTADMTDEDDNVIPDDDYNNTNVDGRDYTNGEISADSFMSYIRSGFGLLGNYGLISLMSGLFSYIPASVWVLLKAGIAMVMTVALARIVLSVISGLGNLITK